MLCGYGGEDYIANKNKSRYQYGLLRAEASKLEEPSLRAMFLPFYAAFAQKKRAFLRAL